MEAPDYLSPSLHPEYDRLTDQLSPATRYRDAAIIARALHEGYRRGRVDAIADLLTSAQVADDLGITRVQVIRLAGSQGVGWRIGRDVLFTPDDLATLHARPVPGRPSHKPRQE
jgi:hypothetical protein